MNKNNPEVMTPDELWDREHPTYVPLDECLADAMLRWQATNDGAGGNSGPGDDGPGGLDGRTPCTAPRKQDIHREYGE